MCTSIHRPYTKMRKVQEVAEVLQQASPECWLTRGPFCGSAEQGSVFCGVPGSKRSLNLSDFHSFSHRILLLGVILAHEVKGNHRIQYICNHQLQRKESYSFLICSLWVLFFKGKGIGTSHRQWQHLKARATVLPHMTEGVL